MADIPAARAFPPIVRHLVRFTDSTWYIRQHNPKKVTAAEAKARLNIGAEVSDEVIDAFIMASRQQLDGAVGWLNRASWIETAQNEVPHKLAAMWKA